MTPLRHKDLITFLLLLLAVIVWRTRHVARPGQ